MKMLCITRTYWKNLCSNKSNSSNRRNPVIILNRIQTAKTRINKISRDSRTKGVSKIRTVIRANRTRAMIKNRNLRIISSLKLETSNNLSKMSVQMIRIKKVSLSKMTLNNSNKENNSKVAKINKSNSRLRMSNNLAL